LAVGAVGTGIGVGLADGGRDGSDPAPAETVDVSLPITYPVGETLPDLGDAPGQLAAIWVTPRAGGGAPEVTGLVAETGAFGTLPIDVRVAYGPTAPGVALSPDGRRIAYNLRKGEIGVPVVHDLMTGEKELPTIPDESLWVYDWIDATHLYGLAAGPVGTTDADGWVWEPGAAAKLVDFVDYPYPGHAYLGAGWPYGGTDLMIFNRQGRRLCAEPPGILEASAPEDPTRSGFKVPVLCDVVGVVGTETLLGHWNSQHLAGESSDPEYADGTVVALDIHGADRPYLNPAPALPRGPDADDAFEDPARRHLVATAGAPHRVAFATDLIGAALESAGGGS
jgi:hypothetical protein